MRRLHWEELEGEEESKKVSVREEVNSITAFLDALLPVLHEVTQGEQGIVAHRDLVFRRPGFHGYQNDARVQLLLVDLLETSGRKNKLGINQSITDDANSFVTHSVRHVHHWFGKILRLCCGTPPLHKLQGRQKRRQTTIDLHLFSALLIIYCRGTPAYQLMVIHHHQLDVLGFCLDGTLASPHLEKATETHWFEPGARITFTQDTNHTHARTHTSIREKHLSSKRQQSSKNS